MCMWQSQAFGGAFSRGGAFPAEFGTFITSSLRPANRRSPWYVPRMIRSASIAFAALAAFLIARVAAHAHPHVWVTMKGQVAYAPDGSIAGVRHSWTFDDMFSTFAVQGLEDPPDPSKEKDKAKDTEKDKAAAAKPQPEGGVLGW